MQRYKFNTRVRLPNESVMTYVSELRALAEHCKFPETFLDELLRDRLVCGINDQQIQRRLLAKVRVRRKTTRRCRRSRETERQKRRLCTKCEVLRRKDLHRRRAVFAATRQVTMLRRVVSKPCAVISAGRQDT